MITHEVEQNTDEWMKLRLGLPTASSFSKLVTSTGGVSKSMPAYAQKLAGDLYAGEDIDAWEGNRYTDRGHEIEAEARLAYAMRGVEVEEVGFITDDTGLYGCSPDGLVGEDGLIEIKCLPKKHISALLYFHKNKIAPPDYQVQVQGQLLITGREWCDLYYYHGSLPDLCIRVFRDARIQAAIESQLSACLRERDSTLSILEGM